MSVAAHVHRSIYVFIRSGIQGQRNLNILDVVLIHWEHTGCHSAGRRAAAPAAELHGFPNGRAALRRNGATTANVSVTIQRASSLQSDRTAAVHHDSAARSCRSTVPRSGAGSCRRKFRRHTDCAAGGDRDVCPGCHGQCAERTRRRMRSIYNFWLACVYSLPFVKWNKKHFPVRN